MNNLNIQKQFGYDKCFGTKSKMNKTQDLLLSIYHTHNFRLWMEICNSNNKYANQKYWKMFQNYNEKFAMEMLIRQFETKNDF